MKKMVSFCAAVSMLAAVIPAYALPAADKAEPTVVALTFDDMATNSTPYGISADEMVATVRQPDAAVQNKAVEAAKKAPIGYLDIGLTESADKMGFSFDLMFADLRTERQIKVVDLAGTESVAFTVGTDGKMTAPDGRVLDTLKAGVWYRFDLMYRLSAKRYDIYRDNQCILANAQIPNAASFTSFKRLRFWADGGGYDSKFLIDNVHCYKGKERLDSSKLKTSFSSEVAEEVTETEIVDDTSVLQNAEFDNEEVGAAPESMYQIMNVGDAYPGNKVAIAAEPDENNRSAHIYKAEGNTTGSAVDFAIDIANAHYVHIEFQFKEEKVSESGGHTILLRSDNPAWNNIIQINTAGVMTVGNKVTAEYTVGEWHEVHVLVNCREMWYETVELDGSVIAEKVPYPDRKAVSPGVVRIETFNNIGRNAASLYIDNFRVYAGLKRRTAEDLNAATDGITYSRMITPEEQVKAWLGSAVSMITRSDKATAHANRTRLSVSAQEIDGVTYLPAAFVAEAFGGSAAVDENAKTVTVDVGGNHAVYTIGDTAQNRNGTEEKTDAKALLIDNTAMLPAEEFSDRLLDAKLTVSEDFCLVVLDGAKQEFTRNQLKDIFDYTSYERPKAEDFLAALKESGMSGVHPRVLANAEEFEKVRQNIKTDPKAIEWYKALFKQAEETIQNAAPPQFKPEDANYSSATYLTDGRNTVNRCILMSLLYQLTGDTKYPQWLWKEIETWVDYSPWYYVSPNYANYLTIGEVAPGIAIAYDWCYDYWTEQQRNAMTAALRDEAFTMFEGGFDYSMGFTSRWVESENNVNLVTAGGAGTTALALLDVYPERAAKILENSVLSIENGLITYVPYGATLEGPGYWDYQTTYLSWMMMTMINALGTDYGYVTENPFLKQGSRYYTYMQTRQGVNNVADSGGENQQSSEVLWLAKVFDDKDLARAKLDEQECNQMAPYALDLLFYDPALASDKAELPLDLIYGDQALMHNEYHTQDSIYVSMHSGKNNSTHGHMDAGTFLIDALGVRWAQELGHDEYSQTNYWSFRQRGYLYRLSTQGQNVLALNPTIELGQTWNGAAKFTRFESAGRGALAVVDLTDVYGARVNEARRGIKLDHDRSQIVVQDELHLRGENDLYWFMHTMADAKVAKDGKSVILKQDGKTMYVTLQTNVKNARFSVEAETPLDGSGVRPSVWTISTQVKRLQIHAPGASGNVTLSVRFIPMEDEDVPENLKDISVEKMQPITKWTAEEGTYTARPFLDGITVDGKPLEGFSKRVTEYTIEYPHDVDQSYLPKIAAAAADDDIDVEITQAESLNSAAQISVRSKTDPAKTRVYRIDLSVLPWVGTPEGRVERKVASYEASSDPSPNSTGIANAFDGLSSTYFYNGDIGSWLKVDLGSVQHVDVVSVRNHVGDTRRAFYDIEVSADGKSWKTVFADGSSGKSADYENIDIGDQYIRYIRFIGKGHSNGPQCSYNDIKFYGKDEAN